MAYAPNVTCGTNVFWDTPYQDRTNLKVGDIFTDKVGEKWLCLGVNTDRTIFRARSTQGQTTEFTGRRRVTTPANEETLSWVKEINYEERRKEFKLW